MVFDSKKYTTLSLIIISLKEEKTSLSAVAKANSLIIRLLRQKWGGSAATATIDKFNISL